MLIHITESCHMGCKHCFEDAKPSNNHMTLDTFENSLEFSRKYDIGINLISGGEPTDHLEFVKFVELACNSSSAGVAVLTNGLWMQDNPDSVKYLNENYSNLYWQVTTDVRYYPIQIDISHPVYQFSRVSVTSKIGKLYPLGRTVSNSLPWKSKCSGCYNFRAMAAMYHQKIIFGQTVTLREIINDYRKLGKFCAPSIAFNGDIKLGETRLCKTCATIEDSESDILSSILSFTCSKCSQVNKSLTPIQKSLIGET